MPNPEHLAKLQAGVETWNTWREENPEIEPDLSVADLSGVNLSVADLSGVNLSRADLSRASLIEADLSKTNLSEADLNRADLSWSHLNGANFREADLSLADLSGVNLSGADLSGANLSSTTLIQVVLTETTFTSVILSHTSLGMLDLSTVNGLETCDHSGPSLLDTHTLAKSKNLPEIFLQGCGLSNWEMKAYKLYEPSLTNDRLMDIQQEIFELRKNGAPIQFHSVFISYSARDKTIAEKLHADLQEKDVRCWFAPKDLPIGRKTRPGINEAIQNHERALLILSKDSIQSAWVNFEIETALEKEEQEDREVIFPIRIDEEPLNTLDPLLKHIRRTTNIGDFTNWQDPKAYQAVFTRLLRDLQRPPSPQQKAEA